jgi:hypothetical protein
VADIASSYCVFIPAIFLKKADLALAFGRQSQNKLKNSHVNQAAAMTYRKDINNQSICPNPLKNYFFLDSYLIWVYFILK